ncbi:hypothetical protein [Streptomyces tsukubensis]|uniref:Uncharacterized protein n=1 Tax=Streptomyces tsukubensis TaxID=83656 RepID=A0A1V4A644_9ACTN|nr:hypothetical protein [Streptomyces tsukubensis]OON76640.1 hypothetical protein B1H18_20105 [Streptomyces tsukubensis]QFR93396.1 hypothetical protein GBW32_10250 [Streptomyces tsukubensis]
MISRSTPQQSAATTPGTGRDAYTSPACRLGEHPSCHGNVQQRLHTAQAPVQTLHCGCACHHTHPPRSDEDTRGSGPVI